MKCKHEGVTYKTRECGLTIEWKGDFYRKDKIKDSVSFTMPVLGMLSTPYGIILAFPDAVKLFRYTTDPDYMRIDTIWRRVP